MLRMPNIVLYRLLTNYVINLFVFNKIENFFSFFYVLLTNISEEIGMLLLRIIDQNKFFSKSKNVVLKSCK